VGFLRIAYVVNVFTQSTGDEVKTGLNNANTYYNSWHYFSVVFNEDADNPYAKLYIDGNVAQTSVLNSIPGLPIFLGYPKSASYQKTNLDIGGYISTDGKVVRTIKGAIDDLRIYSRALSDNEVKLLASTTSPTSSSSTVTNSSSSKSNTSSKITSTSSKTESVSSSLTSSTVSQTETSSGSIINDANSANSTISVAISTPKETKSSNPIAWILIIIAVLLVVAGAVFYIYFRKKSIK
jgi:hypothetical protein